MLYAVIMVHRVRPCASPLVMGLRFSESIGSSSTWLSPRPLSQSWPYLTAIFLSVVVDMKPVQRFPGIEMDVREYDAYRLKAIKLVCNTIFDAEA